jgi:aryl-alcohol dehydrogenase-like predicted oxidoreductase
MEYRILGRSGVKIAPLCLGTDNFANPTPKEESINIINRALDAGINLIDTSNTYAEGECERIIGEALYKNGRRHEVLLATKAHYSVGPGPNDQGNSRLHLMKACEDSLNRLKTDRIDLYQLHRPSFEIPIDETLSALTDLVRQGKVRYIGSSTAPAWKVMEAILVSELKGYARFISEQSPFNLLDRRIENELVPMCQAYNLGILPWSPLAMGVLTGRYTDADAFPPESRAKLRGGIYAERVTAPGIEVGRKFVQLANEHGIQPAQLAVLWVKDQPGITAPLIGPRTLEQLEQFLPVMDMKLDQSLRSACDSLVPPGSAAANFHNSAPWMKMKLHW